MDTIWKDKKNEYTAPRRDSLIMLTYSKFPPTIFESARLMIVYSTTQV